MLLLVVFTFAVYRPAMAELHRFHAEGAASRENLEQLNTIEKQHAEAETKYTDAKQHATRVLNQFPRETDLPAIMDAVDDLARSRGAAIASIDYAQPQWVDGIGHVQVTALFTGTYATITSLVVDIPRVLPSAHVDQMRLAAQADQPSGVEAQVAFTIYLAGLPPDPQAQTQWYELERMTGNQGRWFVRQVERWRGATDSPFRLSTQTAEMLAQARLVGQYRGAKVTGVARTGNQWIAVVEYMSKSYRVKPGDTLGEATVSRIDGKGVTLTISGQSIVITLGGDKDE